MKDTWNPDQYNQFKNERSQPFFELLELVRRRKIESAIDLGCGTGDLTKILHESVHPSRTLGIDNSEAMLSKARLIRMSGLSFESKEITESIASTAKWDLIFSNAALQWCDDHSTLFRQLASAVNEGGQLAIQMPANYDHPTHTIAAELAKEAPFRDQVGRIRETSVLKIEEYSELLYRYGFREQKVFIRVFAHELPNRGAVVEWVKGTLLTYYEKKLGPTLFQKFVEEFQKRLFQKLPDESPFFYAFKRIFIWGSK